MTQAIASRRDSWILGVLACCASVASFLYYFRHGQILWFGDTVAHINIARRVFDSRTPGPLGLGTVWLPLPHLLILPLIVSKWMWRTGAGASLPSMAAYVAGTLGIFRLVIRGLATSGAPGWSVRASAWLAALVYAANPNLLYMQATAMTEPLYLGIFIWLAVFVSEFFYALPGWSHHPSRLGRKLRWCGWLILAATLTRYDGWFAGLLIAVAIPMSLWWTAHREGISLDHLLHRRQLLKPLRNFLLIVAAGPLLWFTWNAALWGNPLEFATGPYSARAIEQRTTHLGEAHYPGWHSPRVAAVYFLKAAKLNVGEGRAEGRWLGLACFGTLLLLAAARRLWLWLLLWAPLPFYVASMAWGGLPIYVPGWWPFNYYNVRFGLQLLPMFAVFVAFCFWSLLRVVSNQMLRVVACGIALTFVGLSYSALWQQAPITAREGYANSVTRIPFEEKLAAAIGQLPPSSTLLMYCGGHVGALQRIALPLRRTINESNPGPWDIALANPAGQADYVIAIAGDPVDDAVACHPAGLDLVATVESPGQPAARIYRCRRF